MAEETRVLAYGKRRLLEIAIALACEPARAVARRTRGRCARLRARRTAADRSGLPADVSVLLIEHDMDLVSALQPHDPVLVSGTVLTEGDPDTIANDRR